MSQNKDRPVARDGDDLEAPLLTEVEPAPAVAALRTVQVIAPATLQEGYTFEAEAGGNVFLVTVPPGGVKAGDSINVPIVATETRTIQARGGVSTGANHHSIPVGAWRDSLFDCCVHGCCHPQLCLSWICAPFALGQVMHRMRLSWYGGETDSMSASKTCTRVVYIVVAYGIILYIVLEAKFNVHIASADRGPPPVYYFLAMLSLLLRLAFFIYMIVAITKTRRYIRDKYSIREKYCRGVEDCCCAYWCPCLTIAQMARHTADYDTYRASCCTETGLPPTVPAIV